MVLSARSIRAALVATAVIAITSTAPILAADPRLRADLEGKPIKASDVSSYYCHDFAYPAIHCYATSAALELAVAADLAQPSIVGLSATSVAVAFGPNDYVTAYSGPTYAGTYVHLSQNYESLAAIGWNDIISSFKARNNRRGVFREHWFGGGAQTVFCCNQTVPSLPAGVDNTFSSVYQL